MRDKLIEQLEELQSRHKMLIEEKSEVIKARHSVNAQIAEIWFRGHGCKLCDPGWVKGDYFRNKLIDARNRERDINIELKNLAAQKRSINLQVHDIQQKSLIERIIRLIFKPRKR